MTVNVGTTAVPVTAQSAESRLVTIRNNGAGVITLGRTPAVVAGAGISVAAAASQQVDLKAGEILFAICAATFAATVDAI